MKLSRKTIKIIGDTKKQEAKALRTMLALELKCTERWILQSIQDNKENGLLTTMASIQLINKETGLAFEEILEARVSKRLAA